MGVESMRIVQRYNDAQGLTTPMMVTPDALVKKYMEVDLDG